MFLKGSGYRRASECFAAKRLNHYSDRQVVFAAKLEIALIMVARRIGEKDPQGAAVAGVQAIIIGLSISLLVGLPCVFYAPELLKLMGASPQVVATGSGYARIALGGSGAIMLAEVSPAMSPKRYSLSPKRTKTEKATFIGGFSICTCMS